MHSTTTASAYCVDAEGVASSEGAIQNISKSFDYDWVNQRVGAGWKPTSITTTSSSSIAMTG